jgi:hypothetical protein
MQVSTPDTDIPNPCTSRCRYLIMQRPHSRAEEERDEGEMRPVCIELRIGFDSKTLLSVSSQSTEKNALKTSIIFGDDKDMVNEYCLGLSNLRGWARFHYFNRVIQKLV